MLSFFERVKTWWSIADPKQKVVTLGGIGALLLVLVGTAVVVTRPHYETLFDGLSDTEKAGMVETLKGSGEFDPQIGRAGVIELPHEQIAAARMKLASAGKLPKGANHWGPSQILSANPMAPPGMEKEILNTVREGEIATSLETMPGVASANVLVTTPKERLFAENQNHPTASVSIVESGNGTLNAASGRIIANLVCNAVEGMTPGDVVVVSNVAGELWNGRDGGLGTDAWDKNKKVAHDIETQLQDALDVTLGKGNTRVLVRADVDNAHHTIREHNETSDGKPKSIDVSKELMDHTARTAGGPAGAASNTADPALASRATGSNGGTYNNSIKHEDFLTSQRETDTVDDGGSLKGLAITVLANSDKVTDESKVKEAVDGIMGGLIQTDTSGSPLLNQPFTTKVTSFKFDNSAQQTVKDATDRLASQQRMQQILSLLPIAAILAVALLVAKQVGKISRAVLPAPPEPAASLAEGADALEGGEGSDALPALGMGNVAGMAALPGALGVHGESVMDLDPALLPETIRDRIDLPLESLKQMANERPEMVATLIKSVMLGERG